MSKWTIYTQYHSGVIEIYVPKDKAPISGLYLTEKIKLYEMKRECKIQCDTLEWAKNKNRYYGKIQTKRETK